VFVVIGWDNYFGFGFTTLICKALYMYECEIEYEYDFRISNQ